MTVNEAIERLECMRLFMEINDKQNESKFLEDDYIANKMAIQALKEIQQYRAIGTIEEFKALKEKNELKKVIRLSDNEYYDYKCPTCGMPDKDCMGKKYCNCGQALEH